jgi:hypothetical protein
MTITLSKEELEEFVDKLQNWYFRKVEYILTNWRSPDLCSPLDSAKNLYSTLSLRFEKDNPYPDWRKLL